MQLKLTRSQRDGGILSKTVLFCLDARVQFTREEQANISRYKLGGQLIYNSEASQRQVKAAEAAMADGTGTGGIKALARFAIARFHLCITVDNLQRGQHIECKSLEELLEAEEALMQACKNLRMYLDTATTFDGREVLVDFSSTEPAIISAAPPPMLAAPSLHVVPPPAPEPRQPSPMLDPAVAVSATAENMETTPFDLDQFTAWFDEKLTAFDQRLAAIARLCRTPSPELAILALGIGLVMLIVLYNVL